MGRRIGGLALLLCVVVLFLNLIGAGLNVTSVFGQGVIYILPNGTISPSTAPIATPDNVIYTFTGNVSEEIKVQRSNIIIYGKGYNLQSSQFGLGYGLNLTGVSNITVRNISITGFVAGIYLDSSSDNNVLAGNNVTENNYGIWLDGSSGNIMSDNIVRANIGYGVLLNSSDYNSLSDNNVTANNYGIWLGSSDDNNLSSNNITANQLGIWLSTSDNNAIFNNNALNNKNGVYLESSSGNTLSGNNITANDGYGFSLDGSSSNILSANTIINNNLYGAYLLSSSNDTLSGNYIANNGYGIWLGSSSDNVFSDNNFTLNREVAMEFTSSSGNDIFHNNFSRNTVTQIYVEGSLNDSINSWDDGYPSGGNYWSDYQGADSFSGPSQNEPGSDGTGDIPYVINAVQKDRYPLMGNFSEFSVSEEPVQIISNSPIAGFTFNGSTINFNVNGPSGTSGFCRIRIPTALMRAPYSVYVNGTEVPYTLLAYSNLTYSYLYLNYTHSTDQVTVMPDSPSPTILLLMLTTVAAVTTFHRRRLKQTKTNKMGRQKMSPAARTCPFHALD